MLIDDRQFNRVLPNVSWKIILKVGEELRLEKDMRPSTPLRASGLADKVGKQNKPETLAESFRKVRKADDVRNSLN